jgi:hypothetical protein
MIEGRFAFEIVLIDHFNTRLVTALNYSAVADLHILYITTSHAIVNLLVCSAYTGRFLATASNSGDSSASAPTSLLSG